MTQELARQELPNYAEAEIPRYEGPSKIKFEFDTERFKKRYGIAIILAAAFTLYSILLIGITYRKADKTAREEMKVYYDQKLAEYHEQRQQEQAAEYFLSGEASREAAINREIEAVAPVIAKLNTDAQKYTEACCMLARVMNSAYPNSFAEVAKQSQQWMFYDGTDNTYTAHDRDIAEAIIRPYMESGIIPNGLTSDMVYGAWSTNDFVLRDSYQNTATMKTWRYS